MKRKFVEKLLKDRDRILRGLCLIGLVITGLLLWSDTAFQVLFENVPLRTKSQALGQIFMVKNDTRHKYSGLFKWEQANSNQDIHLGDSLFTGNESESQVLFNDGQKIDIHQNSMITFTKVEKAEIPNLNIGNFTVSVKGKMKIGINGEIIELVSSNSQIQIRMTGKKKAVLKLIKGQAKMISQGKLSKLVPHQLTTIKAEPVPAVKIQIPIVQSHENEPRLLDITSKDKKPIKKALVKKISKKKRSHKTKRLWAKDKEKRPKKRPAFISSIHKNIDSPFEGLQLNLPERKPASDAHASRYLNPDGDMSFRNLGFVSSKINLEGAVSTMISKEQLNLGKGNPIGLLAGIHWMRWQDDVGLEAHFKTKALDVATDSGVTSSPFQLEVRLHKRRSLAWSPFSDLGYSQVSIFGGYEYYRNSKSGSPFSGKYELFKLGLSLEFPFSRNWDTGGEFGFGLGLDKSTKYEIGGHLNYYLQKDNSVGVGYRVHLFVAGSAEVSPFGLPYREAFGEGYSVIRWHY
jgi:hypothetical protein